MSLSTYTGLQSALTGIQAAQEALDTTSENIANSGTTGYSRQVVNLVPTDPLVLAGGYSQNGAALQVGTGVNAQSITRVRSQYLDSAYRSQNASSNYATTQSSVLGQAQSLLAEP
jgi:flagellar hook-associated protein 1 FlgK